VVVEIEEAHSADEAEMDADDRLGRFEIASSGREASGWRR
jgi:hypothetical protein